MRQSVNLLTRLSGFALGMLLIAGCSNSPSQRQINKKYEKYIKSVPDTKLKKGKIVENSKKLANAITWQMAIDIDSLIRGFTTPEQKYGLETMYCNTAVTTAVCKALQNTNFNKMYNVDLFVDMKNEDIRRGRNFLQYLQKNKDAYAVAAKTIKFSEMTGEDYENMSQGSIIFYRGNYIDVRTGKQKGAYSHTQMAGGKGFSNDIKGKGTDGKNPGGTKFIPSDKGETITINAYSNLFRNGSDNIEIYQNRKDVLLRDVIVVDMKKYFEVIMQQQLKTR